MALHSRRTLFVRLPALAAVLVVLSALPAGVQAAKMQQRTLELSNSQPDATNVSYNFSFTLASPDSVGSIRFQLCTDPFLDTVCNAPAGLDMTSATLSGQTGETGFSISNLSTANVEILTRSPGAVTPGLVSYTLAGVKNPSAIGTLYARLQTYGSTDATGTNIDYGALALSIANAINLSTEVPPFLEFCTGTTISGFDCSQASGDYLNFGELSANATRTATSQLMAATNASGGYAIRMAGGTLTSDNNIVNPMSGGLSQVGVSQFGVNLRQNLNPVVGAEPVGLGMATPASGYNTPNNFRFSSGEVVASTATADNYTKLTASYIVNVAKDQPAGVYVSTITYICLANF